MVARAHLAKKDDNMIGGVGVQSGVDRQWEDLRKQARKLESEIDQKLSAFSKLGNGIRST